MGFFNTFFGWMQAKPHQGDNPALYPLDFEELKKDLDIVFEARRMGTLNSPSPEKKTLTSVEMRIVDRIEEYRAKVVGWSHDHLIDLQRRMSELDITKSVNRARESAEEFKRKANDIISSHEHELRRLDAEAKRLTAELELFKANNRLNRQAKKPTGALIKTLWISLIFLLVLLEGAANAYFFSAGLDGGLIQGFSYAGILATINVIGGFYIGKKGLKWLWHVKPFWKLIGSLGLLLALVLVFGVALITTHLRDAFAVITADGDAMSISKQTMLTAPFDFHGIDSVILFLMSSIFSIFALAKGLTWGDIYPGYSEVTDHVIEARDLHDSQVEQVRDDLKITKEKFEQSLEETLESSSKDIVQLKENIEHKAIAGKRMSNYLGKAEHTLAALIELFRTENSLHRKEPAPSYFDLPVELKLISPPEIDTQADLQDVTRQEALLDELLSQVEPIRGQIQSAFVLWYDQVTPLRDHLKSA